MSKAVLFPVVIRSPVVPLPSWPFSALPNENTAIGALEDKMAGSSN